ncbi:hypothetical protein [Neomoorella thermoacetica]|uniref:hypothetical protein n=1 Tax=Neomoorella thermoacetica TaxID=1525 RepID=UPI0030CE1BDD
MEWFEERAEEGLEILKKLLSQPKFSISGPSTFPEQSGIYAFFLKNANPGEFLRAGRADNLRQRIYQNHLMGNQSDNLRSQLVKDGQCADHEAKKWIRENCMVQYLVVKNKEERKWAEHSILSVLRPKYSD